MSAHAEGAQRPSHSGGPGPSEHQQGEEDTPYTRAVALIVEHLLWYLSIKCSLYFSDSVTTQTPRAFILLRRDVGDATRVTTRVARLGHISHPIWQA